MGSITGKIILRPCDEGFLAFSTSEKCCGQGMWAMFVWGNVVIIGLRRSTNIN